MGNTSQFDGAIHSETEGLWRTCVSQFQKGPAYAPAPSFIKK
jgi:hypothetical protein